MVSRKLGICCYHDSWYRQGGCVKPIYVGRPDMDINKESYLQSSRKGRIKMSVFSKYIQKQIKKKGLTGIVMYVVKQYVKMTPSKKDDEMLAEFESLGIEKLFRRFEGI